MTDPVSIFLVEDSMPLQSALVDLLRLRGFHIAGSATGEVQATDWIHRNKANWNVAIVDLLLQDGSGFSVVRRCRSESPEGRIAVFSEFVTPVIAAKCLEMGADAVFRKSELEQLLQYLEGAAGRPGT